MSDRIQKYTAIKKTNIPEKMPKVLVAVVNINKLAIIQPESQYSEMRAEM